MSTKSIVEIVILIFIVGGAIGQFIIQKHDKRVTAKKNEEMTSEMNTLNKEIDTLSVVIEKKNELITNLEKRVNVINSFGVFIQIGLKTATSQISNKETSTGLQNMIGFFTKKDIRYRFVTNFQFSSEQVTENIKRVYFKYSPEEPSEILGKPINFIENFKTLGVNFTGFVKPLNLNSADSKYEMTLTILLNGIEVIKENRFKITHDQLVSGTLSFDVSQLFDDINKKYKKKIENAT